MGCLGTDSRLKEEERVLQCVPQNDYDFLVFSCYEGSVLCCGLLEEQHQMDWINDQKGWPCDWWQTGHFWSCDWEEVTDKLLVYGESWPAVAPLTEQAAVWNSLIQLCWGRIKEIFRSFCHPLQHTISLWQRMIIIIISYLYLRFYVN